MLKYIILAFSLYSPLHCMETTSFDYTRTQNPLFTKPQTNTYNIVTLYDPHMLNKKNIATHLNNIHEVNIS